MDQALRPNHIEGEYGPAAAVNLRAAAKAQSVVAVAVTKRMWTPASTADTRSRGPWRERFSEAGLVSGKG
jgi:hypothetical protein